MNRICAKHEQCTYGRCDCFDCFTDPKTAQLQAEVARLMRLSGLARDELRLGIESTIPSALYGCAQEALRILMLDEYEAKAHAPEGGKG